MAEILEQARDLIGQPAFRDLIRAEVERVLTTDPQVGRVVEATISDRSARFGLSDENRDAIDRLTRRTGETPDTILRKALTFYSTALEEDERGNRIAVLDPTDLILREIRGFQPEAVIAGAPE